ncbi:dTDP-4-dehydrorhamnose reductase [Comamonas endophytica]|uniref:dTDP-4-dehydrorhamnose reductase n=1 Tax=Comamonas endophytica TaxID=2949090 RepID=A0ABY6G7D1_9BURK|nr:MULTISPECIES: dTDP-4-dehydrorhamnose reductase [unclassified Acidovorax]MCD2511103.1 dTDP-4-dehydrorhamnose reductase [Acidovorax sp. D4N7]UYG50507.1 dTDP-4-dehydrorhamnose reductase [Acidovorax sp. 5MLIR]
MRIALLGPTGQVGWELQRSLAVLGEVVPLGREAADFNDPEGVARSVRALRPDVIVNAAAHTAVDKAEAEPERARLLNAATPALLAREASALGALLVHYSTDYVFDGSGSAARAEDAATAPLSVYGRTKLEGEHAIAESGCRHLIFRTSWVYAARGGNFAKTMLRLAQERERLTVIDDQWGAPTGADLIADVTAHAIRHVGQAPQDLGLYHLVASGETCWHAYAQFVIETARGLRPELPIRATEIAPVPTSAFPTPARRPLNSRLDTTRLQSRFGLQLPDWWQGVVRMLQETL